MIRKLRIDHGSLDIVAGTASFLCAIHCAILPLLIAVLPLWGLSFLASETVEWILIGIAAVVGLVSLAWGYRRHRSRRLLSLLPGALALLVLGHMAQHRDWPVPAELLLVVGGLLLAGGQLLNYHLCRRCPSCSHHPTAEDG